MDVERMRLPVQSDFAALVEVGHSGSQECIKMIERCVESKNSLRDEQWVQVISDDAIAPLGWPEARLIR